MRALLTWRKTLCRLTQKTRGLVLLEAQSHELRTCQCKNPSSSCLIKPGIQFKLSEYPQRPRSQMQKPTKPLCACVSVSKVFNDNHATARRAPTHPMLHRCTNLVPSATFRVEITDCFARASVSSCNFHVFRSSCRSFSLGASPVSQHLHVRL